ncbi:hypothetical protein HKX48_004922 [Thoreauomyces humboldtii]|nr:hypothetical protein HKX48_004922 [Thoreauomyces humboldtii]
MTTMHEPSSPVGRTPTQFLSRDNMDATGSPHGSQSNVLPPSPSELILTRCAGWLSLVRILVNQFEEQTSLEKHMAQSHTKSLQEWTTNPSHERDAAFSNSNSIQDLCRNLRETTGKLASEHEAVHKVLSNQTLPALKSLEKEIHARMAGMMADDKAQKKQKDTDERELRALIKELSAAIVAAKGTGEIAPWTAGDPWTSSVAIKRHIAASQLRIESDGQTLDGLGKSTGVWEQNLINRLKSALLAYTALSSVSASSHGATQLLEQALQRIDPVHEWNNYSQTQLAHSFASNNPFQTDFPGSNDPMVEIAKEGPLLRKSKGPIMKKWSENWYILTNAGWLHEFNDRPNLQQPGKSLYPEPEKSLWLKSCYMTSLGVDGGSASEWHVTATTKSMLGSEKKSTFKFSSNSIGEAEAWYAAMSQHVPAEHRSGGGLPASPTMSHNHAGLEAAVAGAGAAAVSRRHSTASTASDRSQRQTPIDRTATHGGMAGIPASQNQDTYNQQGQQNSSMQAQQQQPLGQNTSAQNGNAFAQPQGQQHGAPLLQNQQQGQPFAQQSGNLQQGQQQFGEHQQQQPFAQQSGNMQQGQEQFGEQQPQQPFAQQSGNMQQGQQQYGNQQQHTANQQQQQQPFAQHSGDLQQGQQYGSNQQQQSQPQVQDMGIQSSAQPSSMQQNSTQDFTQQQQQPLSTQHNLPLAAGVPENSPSPVAHQQHQQQPLQKDISAAPVQNNNSSAPTAQNPAPVADNTQSHGKTGFFSKHFGHKN